MRIHGVKSKGKMVLKAYVLIFSGTVCRAVQLGIVLTFNNTKFIKSFERLISRREDPSIIYTDNAKPFNAGVNLFNSIYRD